MAESNQVYTVLARRYRPQRFEDVVGQEHVVRALQNAIRENRVAHAYLFTGARGVGKTSTARILAKALNCPNAVDGVPCNTCDICRSISAGNDMDVLEIDGASNRGIDDIRRIRSSVNVKSMRTRYRVYIIDEVHMLTTEAFNALLKTLEEPPPNVKFVFCTTEPQKVPETILSRCQRFDFGTIPADRIAGRLKEIAQQEGKQVEDAAIELVARRAAGSLRDSQSLFDQLLAFGGEVITAEDVHRLLGTAPEEQLVQLGEALTGGQSDRVLRTLDTILAQGVQIAELMDQLLDYARDLMVLAAGAEDVPLQSVSEASRPQLAEHARRLGLPGTLAAMQILSDARQRMQRSVVGRAIAEMALVRVTLLRDLEPLAEVIRRVRRGEGAVRLQITGAAAPASSVGAAEKKTADVPGSLVPPPPRPPDTPAAADAPHALRQEQRFQRGNGHGLGATSAAQSPLRNAAHTAESATSGTTGSSNDSAAGSKAATGLADSPPAGSGAPHAESDEQHLSPGTDSPRGRPAAASEEVWKALVDRFDGLPGQHLRAASRAEWAADGVWELTFPGTHRLSADYWQRPDSQAQLVRALREITGRTARVTVRIDETVVKDDNRPDQATLNRLIVTAPEQDPLVGAAVKYLEARITDVRDLGPLVADEESDTDTEDCADSAGDGETGN